MSLWRHMDRRRCGDPRLAGFSFSAVTVFQAWQLPDPSTVVVPGGSSISAPVLIKFDDEITSTSACPPVRASNGDFCYPGGPV